MYERDPRAHDSIDVPDGSMVCSLTVEPLWLQLFLIGRCNNTSSSGQSRPFASRSLA